MEIKATSLLLEWLLSQGQNAGERERWMQSLGKTRVKSPLKASAGTAVWLAASLFVYVSKTHGIVVAKQHILYHGCCNTTQDSWDARALVSLTGWIDEENEIYARAHIHTHGSLAVKRPYLWQQKCLELVDIIRMLALDVGPLCVYLNIE